MTELIPDSTPRQCVNPACRWYTVHDSGICAACRRAGYILPVAIAPEVRTFAATRSSKPGDEHVTESDVQKLGNALLIRMGWYIRRLGQYNARRTQDPGPPDTIAMKPGVGLLFVEYKKPVGGVQSAEQREFEQQCIAAGTRYWLISSVEQLHTKLHAITP